MLQNLSAACGGSSPSRGAKITAAFYSSQPGFTTRAPPLSGRAT